jgi:MFS transporter, MHS family, alpha-ketoglutarate permease
VPEPADPRPPLRALLLLGAAAQASMTLPMFAAPFVAKEFGLADARVAFLSGLISLGAFGAFVLSRLADRHGRRLVMRLGFAALAPLSLVTALAPSVLVYTASQLLASAFRGSLNSVVSVAITEVSAEGRRARNHGWLGLAAAAGSGIPLGLAAGLGDQPSGWRWLFGFVAAFALVLPWVWRRVPETSRFEQLRADGAAHGRVRDLLAPPWRRRSIGLVIVGVLRGAGLAAVGTYAFYHAVTNLKEPAWVASAVLGVGGGVGMIGNGLGALLSERWGRRPTQVAGALVTMLAGIAYYWVPGGLGMWTPLGLALAFLAYVLGIQTFSVADRLVDTELFPTRLRGTYAGVRTVGDAAAATLQNFGLSAAIGAAGSLRLAMALMVPALVIPALALFWWVTTESRGLSLDEAALEKYPGPT